MQESFDNFLKRMANEPELKANLFAWLLAKHSYINKESRDKMFNSIFPLYQKHFNDELTPIEFTKEEVQEEIEEQDYRIKNFLLSSVRGFPKSEPPFGIDFTEDDEIKNAIILGANGIGKSSIFTSLEYVFGGNVGEAKLRNQNNFENYISHFNSSFTDCFFKIETTSGNFTLQEPISKKIDVKNVNPDSHFISDYDIYKNGQLDYSGNPNDSNSFHYLIASSLGLQELMNFNDVINQLSQYRRAKEKTALKVNETNKDKYTKEIENWEKEILEKERKLKILNISQKQSDTTESDKRYKEILNYIRSRKLENIELFFDFEKTKSLIETFYFRFPEFDEFKISSSSQSEVEFLSQGIRLLEDHDFDNCPFCKNSDLSIDEIKESVTGRISRYKEYTELYSTINSYFNYITENVETIYTRLSVIKAGIETEVESIGNVTELFSLLEEEKKFSIYLTEYLSNDFFSDINQISKSTENIKIKFSKLFHCIEANQSFLDQFNITEIYNEFRTKRIELFEKGEVEINSKLKPNLANEEIIILNNDIKKIREQIVKNKSSIEHFDKEIETIRESITHFEKLIADANSYKKVVSKKINETVNKYFDPISDMTVSILSDYLQNDEVKIKVERESVIDLDTGEILSEIINAKLVRDHTDLPISPNKYFNTFRYRLFCMMVSISVAMASRLKTKVNFPIVLDDVFYASDFSKRITIEKFIKNLFSLFRKHSKDIPLQLILFTHDELIFDSAISAVSNTIEEKNTIFSKLLHHNESELNNGYLKLNYNMPIKLPESILHLFK